MLQNIRDRATGPVAWIVIGLLIIGFSLWGIESYFTTSPNPKLAEVGDVEITRAELQRAYDQRYQRLQAMLGENFRHDLIDPAAFRRGVLDELVQSALLDQYVEDEDYRVSDTQILGYLGSIPAFQVDGRFSPEAYRTALAREGMKASYFEDQVRSTLQIEQMRSGLLESAIVTNKDIETFWRLEQQKREAAVLTFDVAEYEAAIVPGEAAIAARYEQDKAAFVTPERLRIEYVELDKNTLPPAGAPEEELLRALYEAEKQARFSRPEQRQARHLLIQASGKEEDAKAQQKALELSDQLSKGADFAKLANSHSDDPGSKTNGGLLDPVTRGVLDPTFENALFSLKTGETSKPVRSSFGWHIIRLERIEPEQVKPFSDPAVRTEVLALYREREADERFRQMAEQLDELSFKHADSLQPLAQALDLKMQSSDWITRTGPNTGIGAIQEVVDTAFSDVVLKDKVNSAPIKAGANRMIVLRVAVHEASSQRPLAEVKSQIVEALKQEAARKKAQADGEKALAGLRKGSNMGEVTSQTTSFKQLGFVGRQSSDLSPVVQDELFRMPRPKEGKPVYAGVSLPDGSYTVLMLTAVQDGNPAAMSAEDKAAQVQILGGRFAGAEFAAFKHSLEKDIKVKVNESQL